MSDENHIRKRPLSLQNSHSVAVYLAHTGLQYPISHYPWPMFLSPMQCLIEPRRLRRTIRTSITSHSSYKFASPRNSTRARDKQYPTDCFQLLFKPRAAHLR